MGIPGEFSVFDLSSGATRTADIDRTGNPIRKRRRHAKSKFGCALCRERKVKCDEKRPACLNCLKHSLPCDYEGISKTKRQRLTIEPGVKLPSKSNKSTKEFEVDPGSPVNLRTSSLDPEATKLLHHFQVFTCPTLLFGNEVWEHHVIPLAFENKYLIHAILLISAAHLRYLHPQPKIYARAEAYHLSMTLSGFRAALKEVFSCDNADVRTACSLLLLHHAWSVPYSAAENSDPCVDTDIGSDNLLSFSAGLKIVLAASWHAREKSIFKEIISASSFQKYRAWAKNTSSTYDFNRFFVGGTRLKEVDEVVECEDEKDCIGMGCGSLDAIERLLPILRVVDSISHGLDFTDSLVDICGYLSMWPGKSSDAFRAEVSQNDEEALLVMLCFYASVARVLSKVFWWVGERSEYMCRAILGRFRNCSEEFEDRVVLACKYFDIKRR